MIFESNLHLLFAALIGLVAGVVGGLAGIGGSLIMLPALGLIFGYDDPLRTEQHSYQAATMMVNLAVAIPATWSHRRAGVFRKDLLAWVVPSMAVAIVAGVACSNLLNGRALQHVLAGLVAWDSTVNIYRLVRRVDETKLGPERAGRGLMLLAGGSAGFAGGIAGLGGGVLVVPILQLLGRVPLKHAIATSSAAMCVSSAIGAAMKLGTLGEHGRTVRESVFLALLMAPGAIVGAMIGSTLTHKLPVGVLRLLVSLILLTTAIKLAIG